MNNLDMFINVAIALLGLIVGAIAMLIYKSGKGVSKKLEDIKNIRNEIKLKLQELKNMEKKTSGKESIQLLINDLKTQEGILKMKLMRQTVRIRRAFPSMKSEKFKQIAKYLRK